MSYCEVSMKKSLLIIGCSDSKCKKPGAIPANQRYTGNIYVSIHKACREGYFPTGYLDILIISAKYGLIEWDTAIDYYCQEMKPERANELRPQVQERLQSYLEGKNYDKLYICMGEKYRRTLEELDWKQHFNDRVVATGIRTDQRKQLIEWLKDLSAKCVVI